MRFLKLTVADARFQFKYGFYFLYALLSAFYICLLSVIPQEWRKTLSAVFVYSDPAAMGLYFMGAIVLLEKSQRVINSIAVSPVKISEYVASKVLSLALIGTTAGVVISIFSKTEKIHLTIIGIFLSSVFFSLIGMTIAIKIRSLNQFVIATVPFEILFTVPPILALFGVNQFKQIFHPGVSAILLIFGNGENVLLLISILLIWILGAWVICVNAVKKEFIKLGGVSL